MNNIVNNGLKFCMLIVLCSACKSEPSSSLIQSNTTNEFDNVESVNKTIGIYGDGISFPGTYNYDRNLNLERAVRLAGGLNECGSMRGIKINRTIDGKKVLGIIGLTDTLLPNDIVIIPCSAL